MNKGKIFGLVGRKSIFTQVNNVLLGMQTRVAADEADKGRRLV